jgi:hypothetical protein
MYLTEGTRSDGGRSVLDAALSDAQASLHGARALWLGALGYLVVLEAVGGTLGRPKTRFTKRSGPTAIFMAGAREFSPTPVTLSEADALYALRSSLAHSFDLRNCIRTSKPPYRFALTESGDLITAANPPWDGITRPAPVHDIAERRRFTTLVNVWGLGQYVEALVANLRSEHIRGRVALLPEIDPADLMAFGQFYVG